MPFRTLPEPDGGWRGVLGQLAAVAVSSALATFIAIAFLVPLGERSCSWDGASSAICPDDPAHSRIVSVRWADLGGWWALALALALLCLLMAVCVSIFLATAEPWSVLGGAPATLGAQAAMAGVGLGLIVGGAGYVRAVFALALVGAGLLAWLLAWLLTRRFVRTLRRRHAEHLRGRDLREHGRCTRADVLEVRWLQGASTTDRQIFEVRARPRGATLVVDGMVGVPRADAPMVGGTVLVHQDDDPDHPTGIAVVIDPDPESIRDPDAEERYPDLSAD